MAVLVLASLLPLQGALGQNIGVGEAASQRSVEIHISEQGDVGVKHIIRGSGVPVQVGLIEGTRDGIAVTDESGAEIQHGTVGEDSILLFPSNGDYTVQYELGDVLELRDGMWRWDFLYREDTKFFFPEFVEMIYVDGSLAVFNENSGMFCHGCQMILEYRDRPDVQHGEIAWEDHKFVLSNAGNNRIGVPEFGQPSRSISFDTGAGGGYVTLLVPQELLGKPYQVYHGDQKIPHSVFPQNDTHAWVNFKPDASARVSIIGATAIPEFSLFLPLILGMALIMALQYRNVLTLR